MQTPYRKPGKFSQMKMDPLITAEKINELKKDLERLKKLRPTVAEEVARLGDLGDFSENAGYQFAKGRLRGINSAISRIESQLNHAEVIPTAKGNSIVQLGHKVTVERDKKQITYQILGSEETSPGNGIISHNSPLGSALLGHEVGDVVALKMGMSDVKYKIIKIE